MTPLFKKLNFKEQKPLYIINAPKEFEQELTEIKNVSEIKTTLNFKNEIEFILAFVKTQAEIQHMLKALEVYAKGDSIVWFAYPKGTSKKYTSEVNRDKGWEQLRQMGFEPVRSVAIDSDWTGLRFRRVEFIKTMSRNWINK